MNIVFFKISKNKVDLSALRKVFPDGELDDYNDNHLNYLINKENPNGELRTLFANKLIEKNKLMIKLKGIIKEARRIANYYAPSDCSWLLKLKKRIAKIK